jgi:hypothetical protein
MSRCAAARRAGLVRGSVSLDYYDKAPFPFNGAIHNVNVRDTS